MKRIACVLLVAATASASADPPPPPSFAPQLRAAAQAYIQWGDVDHGPRFAPTNCAAPSSGVPVSRLSAAAAGPHGHKIYHLFVSDRTAYLDHAAALAVGTTAVKRSFDAVRGASGEETIVDGDGASWHAGAARELFIMTKVSADPAAAGTDRGWVYGTVAGDGTVTSDGRVASCMGCHAHATHERLFGLAKK